MKSTVAIRKTVRLAYGRAAKKSESCCSGFSCCGHTSGKAVEGELGLSCGDPVAFSKIRKGMTVVDLGSGAGKDVFIAAGIVGPKGRAIGVDMTPEMLRLAKRNLEKFTARTGLANVAFRKGIIEKLPVADGEADLIISNCVINLSPDKPAVFREAFRALKPGGKLVVSDIVLTRALPPKLKRDAGLYAACVAGALLRADYIAAIKKAGFKKIKTLSDKVYSAGAAGLDPITSKTGKALEGAASSLTIEAVKAERRNSGASL